MAIVTISRDSYSHGKEIAEKVAAELGYRCVGPEVIKMACESTDLDSAEVEKALRDCPTVIENFSNSRQRLLATFRAAFFEFMTSDNIVYHGLAGHVFLDRVPNVLKVHVVADIEDRIRQTIKQTGDTRNQALHRIKVEDEKRHMWTNYLYGKDDNHPEFYNISVNLQGISVEKAVRIILDATKVSTNGYAPQMKKRLGELAVQAKAEARLYKVFPEVTTNMENGELRVLVNASVLQEDAVIRKTASVLNDLPGLERVRVSVADPSFSHF